MKEINAIRGEDYLSDILDDRDVEREKKIEEVEQYIKCEIRKKQDSITLIKGYLKCAEKELKTELKKDFDKFEKEYDKLYSLYISGKKVSCKYNGVSFLVAQPMNLTKGLDD